MTLCRRSPKGADLNLGQAYVGWAVSRQHG